MIINQLFVDKFRGRDTLRIKALASRLNVIQLPGVEEVSELHALIPSILSGDDPPREQQSATVYGSCVVQVGGESFEVRRRAEGNGSPRSERQVLEDDGQSLPSERLLDALEPLNIHEYLALYTDHLTPAARVLNWPQSLRNEFCSPQMQAAPESEPSAQSAADRRQQLQGMLLNALTRLQAQQERLQQTVKSSNDSRMEYCAARAQQKLLQERLATARHQEQSIATALANCELALRLHDEWSRKQELESLLTDIESSRVRAEHNERFEQVERQIAAVSRELRAARQRRSNSEEPIAVPPELNNDAWDRVLEDGTEAVRCQLRIDEARRQIARWSHEIDPTETPWSADELREIIRQIRAAASDWRAARQRWQQRRANPRHDSGAAPTTEQSVDSTLETDAAAQTTELGDEIRRVQRQTRHLLQPQLLSRPALIAIGLLFVVGTVSLLTGFFLRMPGSSWTFCLIGLSSMFSASLLKWNLERPRIGQLRAQRTQIAELVSRIEASRKPDRPKNFSSSTPRPRSAQFSKAHGMQTTTDQAIWSELVAAEKRWRELLQQYELPMTLTPRGVITHVRKLLRAAEPESPLSLEQLNADLRVDEDWLATWRRQCNQLLNEPDERVQQLSPQQLLDRLSAHRTRLQQSQLEARELAAREEVRRGLIKLQRQRKRLVQKRQEILADAGVENSAELQQKLAEMRQAERWKQELDVLRAELEQRIQASGQPQAIQELLATSRRAELQDLAKREAVELHRLDAEIRQLREEAAGLEEQIRELVQPPHVQRADWQLQQLSKQIQRIQEQSVALELAGIIQTSIRPKRTVDGENAVQRATQWLRRIWDRPELCIEWEGDGDDLSVIDGDTSRNLTELTDREQQQVVVCLQLALASVMTHRRIHLPILLRDTILAGPPSVSRRVAALLCEIATSGQQILLLTSDTSVAAQFHDLGMPTLIVSRTPQRRMAESREPAGAVG